MVSEAIDLSKADVWALGCLAYELIGEEHPTDKVTHKLMPRDRRLMPDGYAMLQQFVDFILVEDFDSRPSCSEMQQLVQALLWPDLSAEISGDRRFLKICEEIERIFNVLHGDGRIHETATVPPPEFLYFSQEEVGRQS